MNKTKLLWQLQLSNYDRSGTFILSADSNWQCFILKATQMVKHDPSISIDVIVPRFSSISEDVFAMLKDAGVYGNVYPIQADIIANAPVTRYDFPWNEVKKLTSGNMKSYTHVYINDPMLLRHYRALFYLAGCNPTFILQNHFLDSPEGRVVADELSYWHGTVEACIKADRCLWHCDSMKRQFVRAADRDYKPHVVDSIISKSSVWKSGFSYSELRMPYPESELRFSRGNVLTGKTIVWVPNRIGGLGRSLDYTNNGKFMFDVVPNLWEERKDFVVIAGNPSQKITNDELTWLCPAYTKLVDGPLNRTEYRWLSSIANIVVALYTNDTNGGMAALEAIELGATPLFPNVNEYKVYYDAVRWPDRFRVSSDLSDVGEKLSMLMDAMKSNSAALPMNELRSFNRSYSSYEESTPVVMKELGML